MLKNSNLTRYEITLQNVNGLVIKKETVLAVNQADAIIVFVDKYNALINKTYKPVITLNS